MFIFEKKNKKLFKSLFIYERLYLATLLKVF